MCYNEKHYKEENEDKKASVLNPGVTLEELDKRCKESMDKNAARRRNGRGRGSRRF